MDLDALLIERWRHGEERPAVTADRISWQRSPHLPALEIDLHALFGEAPS